MRLNNRGYMLVEVIVSFTLTIIIMFFMTNATVSLKNKADDLYVTTKLEADQLIMTNAVMKDINSMELMKVDSRNKGSCLILGFKDNNGNDINKRIEFDSSNNFKYGEIKINDNKEDKICDNATNPYINLDSMFTKKMDDRLNIDDKRLDIDNQCFDGTNFKPCLNDDNLKTKANLMINIHGYTAYDKNDYGLLINIPYNYGEIEVLQSDNVLIGNFDAGFRRNKITDITTQNIRQIIFDINQQIPSDAKTYDFSEKNDGSVIGWMSDMQEIKNFDGKKNIPSYVLHISGRNGNSNKIIASTDSSSLFSRFYNMTEITNLNILNTDKVKNMRSMFSNCKSLKEIDLSNFNTKNVTDMSDMFRDCTSLITINGLSKFNTEHVTLMSNMFIDCQSLTKLDLSNFKTSRVTNMSGMFASCINLTTLNVSKFDTSNVKYMDNMFSKCRKLTSLNVTGFVTDNVENMDSMFGNCTSLISLDVTNFNTKKVKKMTGMFRGCRSLTKLNLTSFDTKNVYDLSDMFWGCRNIEELDLSSFDTSGVKYMDMMFSSCFKLKQIKGIEDFKTGNVQKMSYMFNGCLAMKNLNLSKWDVSKVYNMERMFSFMESLVDLDISNFKPKKLNSSGGMFIRVSSLRKLDISGIDFSNVEYYLNDWCETSSWDSEECVTEHTADSMFAHSGINKIIVKDNNAKNFISERLKDNHGKNATIEIKS